MQHESGDEQSSARTAVIDALRHWHRVDVASSPLQSLLVFRRSLDGESRDIQSATKRVILKALQRLEELCREDAALIRRSFLDKELDRRIAIDLHVAESTLYRHKNAALDHLAAALRELEQEAQARYRATITARIECPSPANLVAVERPLTQLETVVSAERAPWIVALSGIGGIGKTSLAAALVDRLVKRGSFEEMEWLTVLPIGPNCGSALVTVNHPTQTAEGLLDELSARVLGDQAATPDMRYFSLRQRLKEHRYLIVIDNLETLADAPALLGALRDLANPSKFLLTSRESLFAETDVFTFSVPELDEAGMLAMVRQEAAQRNLPSLAVATDDLLQPILKTVGGNPLAIRFVVGEVHVHALDTVLENLRHAQGKRNEDLYSFIYHRAWEQLDDVARRALFAMQLAKNSGATKREIADLSGIDQRTLVDALDVLVRLNLVERSDELRERRYRIQGLTRTFLNEQVHRWRSA